MARPRTSGVLRTTRALPHPRRWLAVTWAGALAIGVLTATVAPGCASGPQTVRIGYIGGLTGRSADLGTAGRDGVLLAVEEANAQGALPGRTLVLDVADDQQDPDKARIGFRTLVDRGAAFVVGPMTSSIAVTLAPLADASGVALISPTTSTDALTGIKDRFFRVYPDNPSAAQRLAATVRERLGHERVSIIYDMANAAHTETWRRNFTTAFQEGGGMVVATAPFTSGETEDYAAAVESALAEAPDCVFVLASGLDSAVLVNQLRDAGWQDHIIASEWSSSESLLVFGGSAVDGMLFFTTYDPDLDDASNRAFDKAFTARFGARPSFASAHAYTATKIAIEALREAGPSGVAGALARGGRFRTIQGDIELNSYGDVIRPYYLMEIRNGVLTAVR